MSDCRFGVSPVNYPDPDPELSKRSKYNENIFCQIKIITNCEIASFRKKYIKAKKKCAVVDFMASVYLRTNKIRTPPARRSTIIRCEIV